MAGNMSASSSWKREVDDLERFDFGQNWASFLRLLDEKRIESAERSLLVMLGQDSLKGKTFLDIGSGSGLFSLAARRLGARVTSFDFDPQSVTCTAELKRRFFPTDQAWTVQRGSILDQAFIAGLGSYDIVYSWGVLHHTGAMWEALSNAALPVAPGGFLFVAIYNDQGARSRVWTRVKRAYLHAPKATKPFILGGSILALWTPAFLRRLFGGSRSKTNGTPPRGMDRWHDAKDWVGGYPFEVARPEEICRFYRERNFQLERMKTCGGRLGCNEFVFLRT